MNVLWLHSDRTGCGTYRCFVPALTLDQSNGGRFDTNFLMHDQCIPPNKKQLDGMDLVVFQRAVGSLFVDWAKECRARDIKTIFEMDDDLFHIPKNNPAAWFWHKKAVQKLLRQMIDLSDTIVVSTPPLRERIIEETGRKDTTVAFNHLHPQVWGPAVVDGVQRFPNHGRVVIGWQGSNTHDADFKVALPALARILDDYPQAVVRFFGNVPMTVKGVIPETRFQWARGVPFDRYPATLYFMNYDIGLAPVTTAKFNLSKSNLKWLEYSALGVPCVASAVYPYKETGIRHGETGFLASTESEWYTALAALVESADLRRQIGEQARAHVWDRWGTKRAAAWGSLFESLLKMEKVDAQPTAQLTESAGA